MALTPIRVQLLWIKKRLTADRVQEIQCHKAADEQQGTDMLVRSLKAEPAPNHAFKPDIWETNPVQLHPLAHGVC
jgi:hypothetical protein